MPDINENLAEQLVNVVQRLRTATLRKSPGIAETLDWAASLMHMNVDDLFANKEAVHNSLSALIKTREDLHYIKNSDEELIVPLTETQT